MTINHLNVRTNHAPTKEKGRTDQSAPQDQPITGCHSTTTNPLQGWHDLAKPSRNRQQKRSWKRGKQRGRIDAYRLAAERVRQFVVFIRQSVPGKTVSLLEAA